MNEFEEFSDPRTVRAIAEARKAHAKATGKWAREDREPHGADDPAAEAEELAREALEHLDAGRWDEAHESAEAALTLAEQHGRPTLWRNFALLVEEAAEIGRDAQG